MFDFKVIEGDISLDGQNDIVLVSDDDELVQTIQSNLSTNKGEWMLNKELGLDRFLILGQRFDSEAVEDTIREAVFQDERIDSIENLELDFDRKARKLSIKFEIIKTDGESLSREVEI